MAEGATATFKGTANFSDNSIVMKDISDGACCSSGGITYVAKKGGAVHNKVIMIQQ